MRAAVFGLGWWGKRIILSLADSKKITVTLGVDPAPADREDFMREHGVALTADVDAAFADPDIDALIIATPNSLHEPLLLRAVEAGKQVFCEKPLALNVASAKRMLDACDKAGVVLGIGHERRFEPALFDMKQKVESGVIGKPLHVETNFSHSIFGAAISGSWRFDPKEAPGAGFTGRGIHLTDYFVWMFGRAKTVWAVTTGLASEPPATDTVSAHITFENGMTGTIGVLTMTPFYGRFTVFGTEGWIEVIEPSNAESDDPQELMVCDARARRTVTKYPRTNSVRDNFEAWADAVDGRAPYTFTPDQILGNMEIFEAIVTSAERRQVIEIR
jgi:predicted dehydrogenase